MAKTSKGFRQALRGGVRTFDPFGASAPRPEEGALELGTRLSLMASLDEALQGGDLDRVGQLADVASKVFQAPGFGPFEIRALALGGAETVSHPYVENAWVHLCLTLISDMAAAVPLRLRRDADPKSQEITRHPLLDVLAQPHDEMTGRQLLKGLVIDYLHDGEQFWFVSDPKGKPFELDGRSPFTDRHIVSPVAGNRVIEPREEDFDRRGATVRVNKWRTRPGHGEEVVYPAEAVVHVKRHNPYNHLRGVGLVEAISRVVEIDFQLQRFDDALMRNGGQPSLAFVTDQPLSNRAADEARDRYLARNARAENHGVPLFLGSGSKVQNLGLSPREMDFKELRAWCRDQILAAFRVPLVLLGRETESGFSRSGQEEARLAFHEDVVWPLLLAIQSELNANLASRLPDTPFLYFDDSELREDSLDKFIERTAALKNIGVPFRQAAALAGWQPDETLLDEIEAIQEEERERMEAMTAQADGPPGSATDQDSASSDSDNRSAPTAARNRAAEPSATFNSSAYLKAFDDALQPADREFASTLRAIFEDYLDEVVGHLRKVALDPSLRTFSEEEIERLLAGIDTENWRRRIGEELSPLNARLFLEHSERVLAELGFAQDVTDPLNARDPGAAAFLAQKEITLRETVDTLRDEVKGAILRSFKDRDTVSDLAGAIREVLEELEGVVETMKGKLGERALLIARTETTAAANGSRVLTMMANGVGRHQWVSANDDATRRSHKGLHMSVANVGDPFDNGLRWPGDPNGVPSEVINCRCTTVPLVGSIELLEDEAA